MILSSSLVFVEYSQPCLNSFPELRYATLSARCEQYQGYLADNCALPNMSDRLNLLCYTFAYSEMVSSAPITMGITVTLVAPWIIVK